VSTPTQPKPYAGCGSPAGVCQSGRACVPKAIADAPVEDLCVLLDGSVTCEAPYTVGATVFNGTGMCDCSCDGTAQQCDDAALVVSHDMTTCAGDIELVDADGKCHPGGVVQSVAVPLGVGAHKCTPVGSVAGAAQKTLCCRP
jgi:hypothetical protein